jgi:hypothetical protein
MYYQSTARYHEERKIKKERMEIGVLQVLMVAFTVILGFVIPVNLIETYRYEQANVVPYTQVSGQVAGASTTKTSFDLNAAANDQQTLMVVGLLMILGALAITSYLLFTLITTPARKYSAHDVERLSLA